MQKDSMKKRMQCKSDSVQLRLIRQQMQATKDKRQNKKGSSKVEA